MARSPTEKLIQELDQLRARGLVTDEEYAARRQAIISGQVQPPAEKQGGGFFRWLGIGCAGIVGLFIVLVIITAVAGGGDGDDPPAGAEQTPGAQQTPAARSDDVRVALAEGAVGEVAPRGDAASKSRVTIVRILDPVVSTNPFSQPDAGKRWIGFEVIHENIGTREIMSLDWKLRDTLDGEHDQDIFGPIVDAPDLDLLYTDLTPGGKKQGWIYFQVPEGAGIKWLRADPNIVMRGDLYFDAP